MTTIPLALFPIDGPASLLRWGPLPDGVHHPADAAICKGLPPAEYAGIEIPLRGLALDAALRSIGVALGWDVTEDGPAPSVTSGDRAPGHWCLEMSGPFEWFVLPPTATYAEAVGLIARAVAGRTP